MSTRAGIVSDGTAGYADQPVTKPPNWHGLVAWDMLFNNLSTGLFLTAALGDLLAPEVFRPLAKVAYPLALLLLLIDLACLVLDLGDPLRFHHMLRVFKPTSPMSLGTWCLTAYSLPLTAAALIGLLQNAGWVIDPPYELVRKLAVVLGLLPALGSAIYKGVLLSTTSQPGWKDARWLGGYLASAALLLGCAEMLLLAVLLGQGGATALLRPALGLLLPLNGLFLFLLLIELRPALVRIYSPRQLRQRGLLELGGGMFLPLVLILAGDSSVVLLSAVLFVLLGSLAIRFEIIKIPHALTGHLSEPEA
jgi:Ni/Fe-hydrogenase subunit HybB-like protein